MSENKVNFGLTNVHYAPFTVVDGVITYETPKPISGGTEFYADNILYYSASNNQGYDGTLSIANIPEAFAIMFQFEGDIKATRFVLYNCTASRSKVGSSTKSDKTEPNENELAFIALPRATDLAVKTKTTTGTPSAIYDAWYTKVYEKTV
jgi:hypothetical protein